MTTQQPAFLSSILRKEPRECSPESWTRSTNLGVTFEDPLSFFEFNSSSGHERFISINDLGRSKALLGRLDAVIDSSCIN